MKSLDLNDSAQVLLPLFDKQNTCNSFLPFILRDLLVLVKPFTSRDSYSIETFISDIEDISRLYQITNPIHQIIFVKKCFKGPAENLIRSICGITNWSQMKEHFINEFSDRINSAQLHNMLQARRLKPTETLQEYFRTMRDLAHKGAVDDSSLIDYIIDGIPDSSNNKIILYGSKTLSEFKDKLKIYETLLNSKHTLCDTGSQATIINEKTYQKLGYPTLKPLQCTFSGIGRDRVESKENPVLHFFQQGYPLELHTDASSLGFGADLLQKSDDGLFHPIHYFSRKTTVQQEKYSSYELEVQAIIEALKKFSSYLLGTKFKIITDCDAFQKTMHKKDLAAKIARWALMLEGFDYEVCHRPGRQMKYVDALSRYPIMMISSHDVTQKIKEAQNKDEFISQLKSAIKIKHLLEDKLSE
ncbi:transposon Tf2-6 polyprotein [Trichonephila clavipes]|nr:transposon Tf2-6 polyprotein [Trichonephila clavipes]